MLNRKEKKNAEEETGYVCKGLDKLEGSCSNFVRNGYGSIPFISKWVDKWGVYVSTVLLFHFLAHVQPREKAIRYHPLRARVFECAGADKDGGMSSREKELLLKKMGFSPSDSYVDDDYRTRHFLPPSIKQNHFERALEEYQIQDSDVDKSSKIDDDEKKAYRSRVNRDKLYIEQKRNEIKDRTFYQLQDYFLPTLLIVGLGATTLKRRQDRRHNGGNRK